MASYSFNPGQTEYLGIGQGVVTGYPFTMVCWGRPTQNTANQIIMSLSAAASGEYEALAAGGAAGGDPVLAFSFDGGSKTASTATGYTINTWHHFAGVFAANNDRRVFIDGGSKGTNTTAASVNQPYDSTTIAVSADSTPFGYYAGNIAHAAIWNAALSDLEIAELGTGRSPLQVRPQNLIAYWPLVDDVGSLANDIVGGFNMTVFNTPTFSTDGPPIFQAIAPKVGLGVAAAPPIVGITMPILSNKGIHSAIFGGQVFTGAN